MPLGRLSTGAVLGIDTTGIKSIVNGKGDAHPVVITGLVTVTPTAKALNHKQSGWPGHARP